MILFLILFTFMLFLLFGGILYLTQRNGHACGCGQRKSCDNCDKTE